MDIQIYLYIHLRKKQQTPNHFLPRIWLPLIIWTRCMQGSSWRGAQGIQFAYQQLLCMSVIIRQLIRDETQLLMCQGNYAYKYWEKRKFRKFFLYKLVWFELQCKMWVWVELVCGEIGVAEKYIILVWISWGSVYRSVIPSDSYIR